MVADLVLIALGIALQPFRLSAFTVILSAKGGTRKGLGFILGWLASLVLVIAVVVLITGGKPVRLRTVPSTVVLSIRLALGIALIVIAVMQWRTEEPCPPPARLAGQARHDVALDSSGDSSPHAAVDAGSRGRGDCGPGQVLQRGLVISRWHRSACC